MASKTNEDEMDMENKKSLIEIQEWFLALSLLEDKDLHKFVPNVLPKLLFKLNNKTLHKKLLSEILEMISHILKRINNNNFYNVIPIKQLLDMLYQHINYYQYHTDDFYINPYFINLTITFIDIAIKNYIKSLISNHLNTSSSFSKIKFPKIDLNAKKINEELFITKDIIQSIFNLCTVIDKFPNIQNHSYKIFHFFIQILPFIKYSNENIDKNGEFFSSLFKINFDQLRQKVDEKLKNKQQDQDDDDDDDDDFNDNDIEMKEEKKEQDEDEDDSDDEDEDEDEDMKSEEKEEKMEVDIVKQMVRGRNLENQITAIILTNDTPKSSLSHIKMLIKYCQYLLFCGYLSSDKIKTNASNDSSDRNALPGLSKFIYKAVTKNYQLLTNEYYLQEMKKSIIDFFYYIGIECQMISIQEMYISSLIYQYSSNKVFGKIKNEIDFEDETLIKQIFDIYLGSTKVNNESDKIIPCNLSMKMLTIKALSKSNIACNAYLTKGIKVVFDALFSKTTYDKLKLCGLEFIKQIFIKCDSSSNSKLPKLLPIFKQGLLKLLKFKKVEEEYTESDKIRCIAYTLIGDLSILPNATKLFALNLDILILFFDRLQTEQSYEIKQGVLNGLVSLRRCYQNEINNNSNSSLSQILLKFLLNKLNNKKKEKSEIKIVLEWLNDIYPFNNPQIRMTNILQSNTNDTEIKEYALKGLRPRIRNGKLADYPSFPQFINVATSEIFEQRQNKQENISKSIIQQTISFASKCLSGNTIIWTKEEQKNDDIKMEEKDENDNLLLNWLRTNDELNWLETNQSLYKSLKLQSKYIKYQLNVSTNSYNDYLNGFEKYINLILYSIEHFPISQSKTPTLHSNSFSSLIQLICACYPSLNINNDSNDKLLNLFKNILFNKSNLNLFYQRQLKDSILTRTECSKLFAIITLLLSKNNDKEYNVDIINQYQSMLLVSISSYLNKNENKNKNRNKSSILDNFTLQESLQIDGALKGLSCILSAKLFIDKQNIDTSYNLIARLCSIFISSKQMDLINSSCYCLTMFSKYNAIHLMNKTDFDINQVNKTLNIDTKHINNLKQCIQVCDETNDNYVLSLIENLILIVKRFNKNQQYIAESAIQSLSSICGGINDIEYFTKIEKQIFDLKKLPQQDLHFYIGSIWINIVSNNKDNNEYIDKLLNRICKEEMKLGNKLSRCSSCIWLLCIVRFCGHLKCIQDKLLMIQSSFIELLSDSNEFTVQTSSKGLINCYQVAKKANNDELDVLLLKSLVTTLTSANTSVSINKTYRELCQISKKLGEPKLIYCLFDLVSSNNMFNTKFCDTFSIRNTLKQLSAELLNDKIDKIIPVLFRYKFDTNTEVRSTMQELWRIIIINNDDNNEDIIIEKYFDLLMETMIKGLQSNEWKVRASTPLAISSLLSDKTLSFNKISKFFKDLIENLFLVIQDINSMVQKCALQFAQLILNLIDRFTNKTITKSKYIVETLNILMPILETNFQAKQKPAQILSVTILIKICTENTDKYLRPHLKLLIKILLYGLSTLEPKELNYLAVQDQGKEFSDKVESYRINAAQSNPLNAGLTFCVNLINDNDTINAVIPELISIIKGGIGLNSINSACKILIDLAKRKNLQRILRVHSKKTINALLAQVVNTSSPHLKNMYSQVIAYWFAFAKKKYVENTVTLIEKLYFNDETNGGINDDDKRILSGIITFNIAKYSLDRISKYKQIVSLAFVASNDINEDCSNYWKQVITEFGGKQMCLRSNLEIVIQLIIKTFNDTIYKKKETAIISIKDLCELYGDNLDSKSLNILLNEIVLKSLPGKIWQGKIKLFETLISITKYCKSYLNKDDGLKTDITKSLLNEVKRKNKQQIEFKIAAINCLSDVVINLDNICIMNEAISIFRQYVFDENIFNNNDNKYFELLSCSIKSIGNIWSGDKIIQKQYLSWIINDCYIDYLNKTNWMVQLSIYKSINSFFDKLDLNLLMDKESLLLLIKLIQSGIIEIGLENLKFTAIRYESLAALHTILLKMKMNKTEVDKDFMNRIKSKIDNMASNDNKPIVVQQAIKIQKEIFLQ